MRLHLLGCRPLREQPGWLNVARVAGDRQPPADHGRPRATGSGRQKPHRCVCKPALEAHDRAKLVGRLESHCGAALPVKLADLQEGDVGHAGRAVVLQQVRVHLQRSFVGGGAHVGLALLSEVAPAHVVQKVGEGVGDRSLGPAACDRDDAGVARFQRGGRARQVRHAGRNRDAAALEDVLAQIQDRPLDIEWHAGELSTEGFAFHKALREIGHVEGRACGRAGGRERSEIGIPAGIGELQTLTRLQ